MALPALDIARHILSKAQPDEGGELISNMKLQKLLYYCQGFYLASQGQPLFEEEVVAWQYGPVVPVVYHKFKRYGASGIPNEEASVCDRLDAMQVYWIDQVFDYFGQFSAIKLMNWSHSDLPWIETDIKSNISRVTMADYFRPFILNEPRQESN